jgi:hypothetical protein
VIFRPVSAHVKPRLFISIASSGAGRQHNERSCSRSRNPLPVSINHTGPYTFQLDSGTQITIIDSSLAAQLHLATQGAAEVAGVGSRQSASFTRLDLVEAGSVAVANQNVLVYNLQNLHPAGQRIQGVLGEDFLEHFDVLIDNAHRLLCLDSSAAMRAEMKGSRIPLVATGERDGVALPGLLIVAVSLSRAMRPVRLLLDSGTETPKLYNISQYMVLQVSNHLLLRVRGVDGVQQILSPLPPQNVSIASLELPPVAFFALAGVQKDSTVSWPRVSSAASLSTTVITLSSSKQDKSEQSIAYLRLSSHAPCMSSTTVSNIRLFVSSRSAARVT